MLKRRPPRHHSANDGSQIEIPITNARIQLQYSFQTFFSIFSRPFSLEAKYPEYEQDDCCSWTHIKQSNQPNNRQDDCDAPK